MYRRTLIAAVAAVALVPAAGAQSARDYINIVGSSTVFPFTATAAEQFGRATSFRTPKVESTGTGGGMKLFCAGVGVAHPDVTNASRRIKASELADCRRNGVADVLEIRIGFDGLVIASARKAPRYQLTRRDLFLALARQVPDPAAPERLVANPNRTWRQVNPALPDVVIEVLGPPPTSGTRDSFLEQAMEPGCNSFAWLKALQDVDERRYKQVCTSLREDGAFVEAGENDNLIVQKLAANSRALGIFGYSFLDQNRGTLQGSLVEGVAPEFATIADGRYPIARAMYVYVKKAHVGVIPGLREFIAEYTSEKALGDEGYLADKGLVPAPAAAREATRREAQALVVLRNL
ncbi:MAG: phosphate ABC transporter substrate-binding protein [Gammaproteobacteria bacterium]|nr:phosphate ABC transporter substrate-binding protein [Gammaproteobacteria bacterium]